MILEIKNKEILIAKTIISNDVLGYKSMDNIIKCYQEIFGLDVGEYGLNEWKYYTSSNVEVFSVNIREEDLVRLRNNKLDSIIKDCVK
jgi:hypothetical protein